MKKYICPTCNREVDGYFQEHILMHESEWFEQLVAISPQTD